MSNYTHFYILDENKKPVRSTSYLEYGKWLQVQENIQVGWTEIGDTVVSTVFLGVDCSLMDWGEPKFFETTIFDDLNGFGCWRYATWEQAKAGHDEAVAFVMDGK